MKARSEPLRIFVVDDEQLFIDITLEMLNKANADGSQIQGFTDSKASLAAILAAPPDILLLDMNMPGISGEHIIREIRARQLPTQIIVVSGHTDLKMAVEIFRNEVADLVSKPFRRDDLLFSLDRVKRAIHLRKENERYKERLAQADKLSALGLLSAGIAHEINNPNTFLRGNLELLEKYGPLVLPIVQAKLEDPAFASDPNYAKLKTFVANYFNVIESSLNGSRRISKIVSSLLSYSHTKKAAAVPVSSVRLVEEAITLTSHRLKKHEIDLSALGASVDLLVNEQQIVQVLMNLLVNAADALEEHWGSESKGRIEISQVRAGDRLYLEVADNAGGMPPEVIRKIFDPFFTTKPQGRGTGLGLSLSIGHVEANGGTLECYSKVGVGTRFILNLPLASTQQKEVA